MKELSTVKWLMKGAEAEQEVAIVTGKTGNGHHQYEVEEVNLAEIIEESIVVNRTEETEVDRTITTEKTTISTETRKPTGVTIRQEMKIGRDADRALRQQVDSLAVAMMNVVTPETHQLVETLWSNTIEFLSNNWQRIFSV